MILADTKAPPEAMHSETVPAVALTNARIGDLRSLSWAKLLWALVCDVWLQRAQSSP